MPEEIRELIKRKLSEIYAEMTLCNMGVMSERNQFDILAKSYIFMAGDIKENASLELRKAYDNRITEWRASLKEDKIRYEIQVKKSMEHMDDDVFNDMNHYARYEADAQEVFKMRVLYDFKRIAIAEELVTSQQEKKEQQAPTPVFVQAPVPIPSEPKREEPLRRPSLGPNRTIQKPKPILCPNCKNKDECEYQKPNVVRCRLFRPIFVNGGENFSL